MSGMPSLWTYIRNYKFNSIFIRNFLVILLLITLPLACVHYLVYRYNDSAMKDELSRSSLSELTRIRDTVDIIVAEVESLSVRLGSDSDVEQFQRSRPIAYPLDYPTIERIRRIQKLLSLSILTNPYVHTIQLYFTGKKYLISDSSAEMLDRTSEERQWWYPSYRDRKDRQIAWTSTLDIARTREGEPSESAKEVVLFRQLPTSGANQEGVMIFSVSAAQLEPLLKAHVPEQEIYIVDRDGRIVFTHDQTLINRSIRDLHADWSADMLDGTYARVIPYGNKATIVSAIPSSLRDWVFLSTVPLERDETSRGQLHSFIALLVLIGIASSLIIAFLISVKTYQPIRGILSLLESGSPSVRGRDRKTPGALNEMKYIAAAIIQSEERKKELEAELERRYEMMSRAQAIALQAQINPHMLYNTLEAVNWKVIRLTNGKNEASAMIHALSRLLRLSLSAGDNIIPLRTEVEHARLYVEVQQMHYKDELEVIWKINEGILDCMTVRLTLQPIIENAIHHGIRPANRPGLITVTGYVGGDSVILRIKDNGVGVSPLLAERINQSFASLQIRESDHIGLSNVNQRIKLIFGEAYGLKLSGKEGEGTIVEMRLPKKKSAD